MKTKLYWFTLFGLIILFFKNAFGIGFFKDDLFFLNISHINSFSDFINFFNPFIHSGYRPIPIQLFYYPINIFNLNFFSIHLIIFMTFFVGIWFLYKNILNISGSDKLSKIAVFLYSISFIHVFQLYAAWNFQEVCLFTFLNLSFYYTTLGRNKISFLFFLCALLSKETAIFFPIILFALYFITTNFKVKTKIKISANYLWLLSFVSILFGLMTKYELSKFAQNPLYSIRLEPRLILNNLMWLGLWVIGFPSYLPDYLPSIFGPPLPDFYKALVTFESRIYWLFLLIFLGLLLFSSIYLILSQKNKRGEFLYLIIFTAFSFALFNLLTLPTIHKTMIRLMIPLVFVSILQGYVISRLWQNSKISRVLSILLLVSYLLFNYYGTIVHESASTFKLESAIYFRSRQYFEKRRALALKKDVIYLMDLKKGVNPWGGSKKLKDTFWNQNFVKYIFPEKEIKMIYGFEHPNIPKNALVVPSSKLLLD